jgi:hypothetical protein
VLRVVEEGFVGSDETLHIGTAETRVVKLRCVLFPSLNISSLLTWVFFVTELVHVITTAASQVLVNETVDTDILQTPF